MKYAAHAGILILIGISTCNYKVLMEESSNYRKIELNQGKIILYLK